MTDGSPTDRDAAPCFFDGWDVYASIVARDLMHHRAIFRAIRQWTHLRRPGPFTLVDLGCGDCGFVAATFTDTGLWRYTGVDASRGAVDAAAKNLAGARFETRLVQADMLDWLHDARADDADAATDVLLSLYSVHHLPVDAKRTFFERARAALAPGGTLLFGDMFRRAGESRAAWVDAFVAMMRVEWSGLPPGALGDTIEHLESHDHPETVADLGAIAAAAGFAPAPHDLFHDAAGFYRLLAFTKPAR